jgi:hypothetical protein
MSKVRVRLQLTSAVLLAVLGAPPLAGCIRNCTTDAECGGTQPVCDVKKCGCLDEGSCVCIDACAGDDDCSADFFCNAQRFCEVRDGRSDPDCGE